MTREAWLEELVEKLTPFFDVTDFKLPHVRVSVGFPSRGGLAKVIGECWVPKASADNSAQIFISPKLIEPWKVAETVLHEMIHAATPGSGHRGDFVKVAKQLGFQKPWKLTPSSEELEGRLRAVVLGMAAYPHAELRPLVERKKQTTRMLKLECGECQYTARTTKKWADAKLPVCVNGHAPVPFTLTLVEGDGE